MAYSPDTLAGIEEFCAWEGQPSTSLDAAREIIAVVREERAATKALERAAVEGNSLNLDISAALDRQERLDAALAKLDDLEAHHGGAPVGHQ